MVVGYLVTGILTGLVSAAISLLLGSSVLWALVVYAAAGSLGVLISAAIAYVRSELSGSSDVNTTSSGIGLSLF